MKNPRFAYRRPETLDDALRLLSQHDGDAKVLAGGQSLLPLMGLRLATPGVVIDIGRIPGLSEVTVGDDGTVTIGALVTHADAEASDVLAERAPLVREAMPYVGHRAIRNRGTVCGSIAHADPAAEMPAVVLAASGTIVAASTAGEREIDAADFFAGYLDTSLRDDELVVAVRFPSWPTTAVGSVTEVARRHGDYALVGLVAMLDIDAGEISRAALSFFGVASTPQRIADAESELIGRPPDAPAFAAAADVVRDRVDPPGDIHGTASYRKHLAAVLTRRGLLAATDRIGVPS